MDAETPAGSDPGRPLEVTDLAVSYDRWPALRGVSFAAGPGELFGVVGPNGGGKSTLLRAIVGLVTPVAGQARVHGRPAARMLRRVAYLPQRSAVDWDYPAVVREVVAMGRAPHLGRLRRPGARDRELVEAALDRLGLAGLAGRPIGELSGGQRQRVFVARALAQEADVLLLDEPFAAVDAVTERLLWTELRRLAAAGATVVLVNHDLGGVFERCDTLLLLARQPVAVGTPDVVGNPGNLLRAYGGLPRTPGPPADERAGETPR